MTAFTNSASRSNYKAPLYDSRIVVADRWFPSSKTCSCWGVVKATLARRTFRCDNYDGISRLPDTEGEQPSRHKFKAYPIGYFHIDIAEVRTEEGRPYLLVAIDRTSKFALMAGRLRGDGTPLKTSFRPNSGPIVSKA
jgi:Putative transposase DNA-binding domain